ncbi:MAG: hypothetical protein Q3983_03905 [Capnocytophaga sp.]|nr:hypothetical protein [Capnocytophaga sp.]
MKKIFLFFLIGAIAPLMAQKKDYRWTIDVSYLKQGSTYGQIGLHYNYYETDRFVLLAGLAGNFRSENKQFIAIPEAQLSAWLQTDKQQSGLINLPILMLRPQLNLSPYYFAPEIGFQILVLYLKAGYAFPFGRENTNYPFNENKFRFSVGIIFPI